MTNYKPYTNEENTTLLTMREQGKPFKEIAHVLGRTEAALWMQYKKLNTKSGNTELKVGGIVVGSVPSSAVEEDQRTSNTTSRHSIEIEPEKVEIIEDRPKKENNMVLKTIREKEKLTPREMIKSLYDLGYRIEDNKLVCYVKQTVNIKDILTETV